jgi:hypothetical protein
LPRTSLLLAPKGALTSPGPHKVKVLLVTLGCLASPAWATAYWWVSRGVVKAYKDKEPHFDKCFGGPGDPKRAEKIEKWYKGLQRQAAKELTWDLTRAQRQALARGRR